MKAKIIGVDVNTFLKRMLKLAWDASQVVGMGVVFQEHRPNVSEDDVWKGVSFFGGCVDADYIFGRMMKLTVRGGGDIIDVPGNWRSDYQSFCHRYPDPRALLQATADSLKCNVEWIEAEKATA